MILKDVFVTAILLLTGIGIGYSFGLEKGRMEKPAAAPAPVVAQVVPAVAAVPPKPVAPAAAVEVALAPEPTEEPPAALVEAPAQAGDVSGLIPTTAFSLKDAPLLGDPEKATVAIIAFSDFECPYCTKAEETVKQIQEKYGDDVVVAFRHFPLDFHQNSPPAHRASWAAAKQDKFWEFHDKVFANQNELNRSAYSRYAAELELDVEQFEKDMDSEEAANAISIDKAIADKAEVEGTPTFLVNGSRMVGALPYEAFARAVDSNKSRVESRIAKGKSLAQARGEVSEINMMRNSSKRREGSVDPRSLRRVPLEGRPIKGAKDPLVAVVAFSDFECSFCSTVHAPLLQLIQAYPDEVSIVFAHNPLSFHKKANLAAQASLAAHAQGKFWEFHDLAFANQERIDRPDLEGYAEQLGLDMTQFKAALDGQTYAAAVAADLNLGRDTGVEGTPSVVVNGRLVEGAVPYDQLAKMVDAAKLQAQEFIDNGKATREGYYGQLMAMIPAND
ncbi:MAG: protein-disulfide isomerase [Myxococcota bacterium]|jgi:protein-disulfide isomerase